MDFPLTLSTTSSTGSSSMDNALGPECFYFTNVEVVYSDRIKKYGTSACSNVNVGAVVGGAVGGLLLLIGIGAGAYFYSKKS